MLGRPHMLSVLHAFDGSKGRPLRFRDLENALHIPPKTLTLRLKSLVEAGFLTRHSYNEIPPRVEYEPTPKTAELGAVFQVLEQWAQRNTLSTVPVVSIIGRAPS